MKISEQKQSIFVHMGTYPAWPRCEAAQFGPEKERTVGQFQLQIIQNSNIR